MKKVLELDEYRVKLLADMVGFDLIEAVVLLDAYLGIGAPGETKAHTARLVSAKLRTLAINRGCVINEAFRSDKGILGRLKKMEAAFGNANLSDADIPQVFVDAVNLYYENRSEYKRLSKLQSLSRQQLIENKIVGVTAMRELTRVLKDNHVHLAGDKIYTCSKCSTEFAAAEEPGDEHYCDDCTERLKRVKKIKDYVVTLEGPDYGSYTDGTRGFTIFATVHNKTKKMVEVKLRDFMIFCDNRQWASTSYLTGYSFTTEHIMPESSKTAAKIWSGTAWSDKRLTDGNYVNVTVEVKDKVYSYKFLMKAGKFELEDYFTY